MTQKEPDLVKAFVSPLPFQLPFPSPSLFTWIVGMVVAWTLLLLLGHALRGTAMGRWLLLVVPLYLIQSVIILLLILIDTGASIIFHVMIHDGLI